MCDPLPVSRNPKIEIKQCLGLHLSLDADQHAMEAIVPFIIIIPQRNLIWFFKAPILCTTSQP